MQLILYANRPAALVTERNATFVGGLEDLPDGHPLLRFVVYMALYARDVMVGELAGPYSDADAERFARAALIDPDEFAAHADEDDEALAQRFRVPVEQIAPARAELGGRGAG